MACGQRHELFALVEKEQVTPNEERAGLRSVERRESGVDFAFAAGLEDLELHPLHPRRFLDVFDVALDGRTMRSHQQTDYPSLAEPAPTAARPAWASARLP